MQVGGVLALVQASAWTKWSMRHAPKKKGGKGEVTGDIHMLARKMLDISGIYTPPPSSGEGRKKFEIEHSLKQKKKKINSRNQKNVYTLIFYLILSIIT